MSLRFWGVVVWLVAFQVFAATSGGLLIQHFWLDVGTAVGMFTLAAFLLGLSLPLKDDLSYLIVLLLIVTASALLTANFYQQMPYPWYDLMIVMAAPQVFFLAIGFWLGTRQEFADMKAELADMETKG